MTAARPASVGPLDTPEHRRGIGPRLPAGAEHMRGQQALRQVAASAPRRSSHRPSGRRRLRISPAARSAAARTATAITSPDASAPVVIMTWPLCQSLTICSAVITK